MKEQVDKPLHDLIDIIHFTENVSTKIHGKKKEPEIFRTVKEEFEKSRRYNASILLLTDKETKLEITATSTTPSKLEAGEKASGLKLKGYKINLEKSSIYNQVVREGKTVQVKASDIIGELVPKQLAPLISKITGYERKPAILTPLRRHGKIIGVLAVSSTRLAEHFIPSVKNLAQHISSALELSSQERDRKRTEEALKESEEKYRKLVEQSLQGIVIVQGPPFRIVFANPAMSKISGYTINELTSLSPREIEGMIHSEDRARDRIFQRFMDRLAGKPGPQHYEFRAIRKDGTVIWLETSSKKIEYGGHPAVQATFMDINERKKSEERYRTLVENSLQGIVVVQDFHIVYVNKAFADISGYTVEELHALPPEKVKELVHPDDQALVWKRFRDRIRGKQVIPRYEYRAVRKDGSVLWLEMFAHPIEYAGKPAVQAAVIDMTQRKRMEETLKANEQKLRDIIDTSPDSIVWTDTAGEITLINRKGVELTGFSKEELVGKNFMDVKAITQASKERILESFMKRIQGIDTPPYEVEVLAKSGEIIPAELSASAIREGDKIVGTQSIFRDLRERKKMERKLKEYADNLEEMVEQRTRELRETQERLLKSERLAAIGELATMVGHDLRNPLQSIENATYYLNNELPRLPASTTISQNKIIEMLQVINKSVNYADKIIKDLYDFSSTRKPVIKKVNINASVMRTLSQVKAPENVELTTEVGSLPDIEADKDMIERVFLNLAENGVQAMKENGGRLKVETRTAKGFVEVSFKDTGVGISKENMRKLFTPFFTTKAKGMGMGLAICKRFVNIHGGTVGVESTEGKGSTFTVRLPIQQRGR